MAATDLEKLVVSLSADFKSYENAMAKASGITRKELASIKAGATAAGGSSVVAFDGAARGVRVFGAGASAAAKQAGALRAQTGNLAAQFQDIAVQLQSGQSPFQIALQQGTQISAVLGGQGAGGAVKALGGAFLGLLSPVSLATIAIIAAGGFAVQYFTSLLDDGEKSADELKKQASLIQGVAKEWGDAVPSLKAYADQLDRVAAAAEFKEAGAAVIAEILKPAKEQAIDLASSLLDVQNQLITLGEDPGKIVTLTDAFAEFKAKVDDGSASAEDAQAVTAALNALMASGIPIVAQFAGEFAGLAGALLGVSTAAGQARAELAAVANPFKGAEEMRRSTQGVLTNTEKVTDEIVRQNTLTKEQLELESETARIRKDVVSGGGVISAQTAKTLAEQTLAAEERRAAVAKAASAVGRGGGGGGGAAKDAEREREAVAKLIEALQFENSLIGATALEKEKANALRRAGAAATTEERAQIEALVNAGFAEVEALKATEDQMQRLKGLSKDVLGGMFEDLRDGAGMAEVLSNALNRVAESLVKSGIDSLIEGAFKGGGTGGGGTGGGGGLLGSLLGAFVHHQGGVVGAPGTPTRTVPTSIYAHAPRMHGGGIAGMRPGEVPAILQRGETVTPRGGSSSGPDVHVYMDRNANLQYYVEQRVARGTGALARQVPGIVANAQLRGG